MKNKKEVYNSKTNVFNNIYFVFFILLPFVYIEKIVDPVLIPRQLYLSLFVLIITVIICNAIYKEKLTPDFSFLKLTLPLLFIAFIVINILSFSQSIAITESIYVLSKTSIEVVFFILTTYLIIQDKLKINSLIKAIVAFGFISATIAFYQVFALTRSDSNVFENIYLITSSSANKNLLASILFLTTPFLIGTVHLSKQWRIAASAVGLIILSLFLLIKTRAVLVAFTVALILFFVLLIKTKKEFSKKGILFIITTSILIVSVFIFNNSAYFLQLQNSSSAYTRLNIWSNSLQMAKENLMLGVGPGNWQIHFPKYGLEKFDALEIKNGLTTFQRPHNDFLWVLCETGFIGMLIYVSIFLVVLFYTFKLLKSSNKQEDTILYAALFSGIVGYIIIAFVDFPLERIEHQLLLFLIFSIVTAHFYKNFYVSKTSKKLIPNFSIFTIALFLPIAFSLLVCFKRYSGEYHTHKLYIYHHQSNWSQMIREADKAKNTFYSMDAMSAPIDWYKGVALFTLGNINEGGASFEKAYAINPYNIHVLNNMASCYETKGDHKKAEEFYLTALTISPEFEEARLNLSAVYYNIKKYDEAFETIDKCDVNSNNPKYYQTYLPAILDSWIDVLLSKQKDVNKIKTLKDIKNNKDEVMQLYKASKTQKITFEQALFKN